MRGGDVKSEALFSYVSCEARVPPDHPLRPIRKIVDETLGLCRRNSRLSDDHFSVDGTLIEAWASMKSFRPKDGSGEPPAAGRNAERDFHGEKRSNETHASITDLDARLYRKGPGRPA
jgi:hypothetical protein